VNWKVPGWAAAAGAVISLVAALVGGNPFGAILLRAAVSALVAGALGLAAQYLLRRFLPGTGAAPAPPTVDILLDEEVPLAAQAGGEQAEAEELGAEPVESLGEEAGGLPGDRPAMPDYIPAGPSPTESEPEPEPFPGLPEAEELGGLGEGGLSGAGQSGRQQGRGPAMPGYTPSASEPDVEELPSEEGLEAPSAADADVLLSGAASAGLRPDGFGPGEPAVPSHRALKAEELENQLDSVTKGQDPASLAKAVRTFLRKDQEV
jgi:hypothetical protein